MSSVDTRMLLAGAIDRELRRNTLTVAEVARRAAVDPATVRRLLAGDGVRFSSVRLVVAALGLDWDAFLAQLADVPAEQPAPLAA